VRKNSRTKYAISTGWYRLAWSPRIPVEKEK